VSVRPTASHTRTPDGTGIFSGGAEHQGPDGGGPVAVIAHRYFDP
jgi:hypothetical protein